MDTAFCAGIGGTVFGDDHCPLCHRRSAGWLSVVTPGPNGSLRINAGPSSRFDVHPTSDCLGGPCPPKTNTQRRPGAGLRSARGSSSENPERRLIRRANCAAVLNTNVIPPASPSAASRSPPAREASARALCGAPPARRNLYVDANPLSEDPVSAALDGHHFLLGVWTFSGRIDTRYRKPRCLTPINLNGVDVEAESLLAIHGGPQVLSGTRPLGGERHTGRRPRSPRTKPILPRYPIHHICAPTGAGVHYLRPAYCKSHPPPRSCFSPPIADWRIRRLENGFKTLVTAVNGFG